MHHMSNSPAPVYPGSTVSPYYCSWWVHSRCAVNLDYITLSTVQHDHTIPNLIVPKILLYQKLQPRRLQPYRNQPQNFLSQTQSCRKSSHKSAITPNPTVLPPPTTPASPINMSSKMTFVNDDEFSKKYCCNGVHKFIFPDDEKLFLTLRQLQSVNDLHIMMKLFWVPDPQGAHNDRAHPKSLQDVLDQLNQAKAGRDGPVLRSLTLEDQTIWRPNDRTNIKRENECLDQYEKMARDAGVDTLRLKWPSGSRTTTWPR